MKHVICDDDCIDKLLTNLKVIGKIGPGFKINTKGKYIQLDDTTYWQGFTRWYRGDSRDTMYEKIHNTIVSCNKVIMMVINDFKEDPNKVSHLYNDCTPSDFLEIMYNILRNAKNGMECLKDTYNSDPTLSSRLEIDIISVQNQIFLINSTINNCKKKDRLIEKIEKLKLN